MEERGENRSWKGLIWGIFLILLGAGFLAERYGLIDVPGVAGWWPIVLFVVGVGHLVDRRPGSAVMFLLLGLIFLASANEWWGLGYHDSWPLLIVAAGVGIVIKALSREDARPRKPSGVDIVMGEVRRDQ